MHKKVSEYEQEIPQSRTAGQPTAPPGIQRKPTATTHHEDNLSKATGCLFLGKVKPRKDTKCSTIKQGLIQEQTPQTRGKQ